MRLLQVASILLLYKNLQSDQQNNTDDTQNSTGNSHTAVLELPPVSWTTKIKSKKQEAFHVRASGIKT